jgi:hypothetical protein
MVNFTPPEYEAAEEAAGGKPVGAWLRELALRALKRVRRE